MGYVGVLLLEKRLRAIVEAQGRGVTARDKFRVNDRVRPTAVAIARMVLQPEARGTVCGFSRRGGVRVVRDGVKTAGSYHPDYWEREEGTDGG